VKERILKFDSDGSGRPAIDGKAFDEKPDTTQYLTLNTAEEWWLENYWDSSIHPFHIHVNPFQVLEIIDPNTGMDTKFEAPHIWRDTDCDSAFKNNGRGYQAGQSQDSQPLLRFPRHVRPALPYLDHEDRGMMQEVPGPGPEGEDRSNVTDASLGHCLTWTLCV